MTLQSAVFCTLQDVESMRYMGAFFKEVARLYPMAHGHIRTLRHDTVLSGYQIPAGEFHAFILLNFHQ